jgi:integrase
MIIHISERDIAKKQISDGIDPSFERKMKKLGATENTFQAIALEWCEKNMSSKSEGHKNRVLSYLNNDLFPWIGSKPIAEVKAPELLAALRFIEGRNAHESAHRALSCGKNLIRDSAIDGKGAFCVSIRENA